jgi:hypothetical protein
MRKKKRGQEWVSGDGTASTTGASHGCGRGLGKGRSRGSGTSSEKKERGNDRWLGHGFGINEQDGCGKARGAGTCLLPFSNGSGNGSGVYPVGIMGDGAGCPMGDGYGFHASPCNRVYRDGEGRRLFSQEVEEINRRYYETN